MKKPRSTKDSEVRSDVIHQRATNVGRGFFTRLEYTSLEEHIPPLSPVTEITFYIFMQILSEEYSDILTFPTGCGISSVSLSYTYGSRNYPFLEYASSDYISSYTNSLLLRKYPYRRQHLLFRRGTSCLVHHRHMDILYAECPSVESLVFHCNNKCSCFRKSKGNIKKQADIVSRGKSKSTFIRK